MVKSYTHDLLGVSLSPWVINMAAIVYMQFLARRNLRRNRVFRDRVLRNRGVNKFFKIFAKLVSSSVFSFARSENNWPKI
jgi:hypothetical protein